MTGRIPFPLTAVAVLFTIIGPHCHSGRYLRLESPCADRTPPQTYTGNSPGGFGSFSEKIDELSITAGTAERGLTTRGAGFYRVVLGDHECQRSRCRTKTPLQPA